MSIEALYPCDFRFIHQYASSEELDGGRIVTTHRKANRDRRDLFERMMDIIALEWLCERAPSIFEVSEVVGRDLAAHLCAGMYATAGIHTKRLQTEVKRVVGQLGESLSWCALMYLLWLEDTNRLYRASQRQTERDRFDRLAAAASRLGFECRREPKDQVLWSLAQHYELTTALLDVTEDIDVAACFAVYPWNEEPRPVIGQGVIYRFDVPRMRLLLEARWQDCAAAVQASGQRPPLRPFIAPCNHIPSALALRPSRQSGLSIQGFDDPVLVHLLGKVGAIEAIEFEHSAEEPRLRLKLPDLKPEDDPFAMMIRTFKALEQEGVLSALRT